MVSAQTDAKARLVPRPQQPQQAQQPGAMETGPWLGASVDDDHFFMASAC